MPIQVSIKTNGLLQQRVAILFPNGRPTPCVLLERNVEYTDVPESPCQYNILSQVGSRKGRAIM